jgi:hypothetical protein
MVPRCVLLAIAASGVAAQDSGAMPAGCVRFNDGCNTCSVQNGVLGGCTEMACFRQGTPFCAAFADGRACTSPTACTGGAATGGGAAEGARCSTTATRGNPNGTPCARGLSCIITDPGHPEYDAPNSGVCTSAARPIAVDPLPAPAPTDFCPASRRQGCRMMCQPPTCPAGQCAMRTGSCCDYSCQAAGGAAISVGPAVITATSGACSTQLATTRPMPGAFVPQCDESGDYMPVQCHASIGSCWCSQADGTEVPGTRMNARSGQVLDLATCAAATHPDLNTCEAGCQGVPSRMPNRVCPDGSMGGPVCAPDPAHSNQCWWQIRACPSDAPPPPPVTQVSSVTNKDGSVTVTYSDGHTTTTYANGMTVSTAVAHHTTGIGGGGH